MMEIYEKVRAVPETAKRSIRAGRLKGKTDINPMWRIKTLTEIFGVCGFGWKYTITDKRLEAGANGEVSAFVDIDLFVKVNGEWSDAIVGTGGSSYISNEKAGRYTNDECFKMALTDAISVACKALGMGADVYWSSDTTKYEKPAQKPVEPPVTKPAEKPAEEPARKESKEPANMDEFLRKVDSPIWRNRVCEVCGKPVEPRIARGSFMKYAGHIFCSGECKDKIFGLREDA